MTTSFKRLILISITLILGVVSGVAQADTNYDFSSNGAFDGFSNVYGTFTVNSSGYVTGGTLYEGGTGHSGGTADPGTLAYILPYIPGGARYTGPQLNGGGYTASNVYSYVSFNASSQPSYDILLMPTTSLSSYPGYTIMTANGTTYSAPNATITQVGAPEIDGSLAPKVGFLLGCLFLMFGRKKQNTEPMLAA